MSSRRARASVAAIGTPFITRRPAGMQRPRNQPTLMRSATPGALVLLLVVVEGLDQPGQHLRRSFEHCLELRLVYLLNILAEVVFDLLQPLLHLLSMMPRVALVSGSGHEWLLIWWFARAP